MAMNLKDMKKEPEPVKENGEIDYPKNNYGYGLEIHLDDKQLKTLGLTKPLPAGTVIMIEAKGIVESTRESVETKAGGDADNVDVNMSIQITHLGIEPEGTATNPAEILYRNA